MQTVTVQGQSYFMSSSSPPKPKARDLQAVRLGNWLTRKRQDAGLNRPELVKKAQLARADARISQDYLSKLEYGARPLTSAAEPVREAIRLALRISEEDWEKETGLKAAPITDDQRREISRARDMETITNTVLDVLEQNQRYARGSPIKPLVDIQEEDVALVLSPGLQEFIEQNADDFPHLRTEKIQRELQSFRREAGDGPQTAAEWREYYFYHRRWLKD